MSGTGPSGEAPAEMWLRPWAGGWYETQFREADPAAVRYVRADLYDKRMTESVNQEPLGELEKAS